MQTWRLSLRYSPQMASAEITSVSNPRIRRLVGLRDRKIRDTESAFLVEGRQNIDRAVAAGLRPAEVYFDPGLFHSPPHEADLTLSVSPEALDRASYRSRSEGVIAVFDQFGVALSGLSLTPDPLVLLVEGLEKPGNLGAVLRTADGVGANAVIAADPATDPFNPNVIRASMGALFTVPLAVTDLDTAVSWLHDRGVSIVAADPSGATDLWSADLRGSRALLVGSEHDGLSQPALAAADLTVSIPMHGAVDSLNASVSAAVLAYEALRQRDRPSSCP
jgi:TrmH family RNA methyltransferase